MAYTDAYNAAYDRSPSSRRAWIEIDFSPENEALAAVALLAEGVDRNQRFFALSSRMMGRPPRGGRG